MSGGVSGGVSKRSGGGAGRGGEEECIVAALGDSCHCREHAAPSGAGCLPSHFLTHALTHSLVTRDS